MNKKICVYTCITGNYDNLHEIEHPEEGVDYICFTNNQKLTSNTWRIVHIEDDTLDNQRLSRKIKMLGHPIIADNYDISVWMDASVVWKKSIIEFVKTYLKSTPFVAFRHTLHNSVHEEAIACLRCRKDSKDKITETLSFLESVNFPDNLGLYEMTVFIKKHNNPVVKKTMEIWFDTVKNHSKRDQLSFVYAAWKTSLKITTINLSVWSNIWFTNVKHTIKEKISDCHIYYGDTNSEFDFNNYQIIPYIKENDTCTIETVIPVDTSSIEINPVSIIGIEFSDITIKPNPDSIIINNSFIAKDRSFFCTNHNNIIKISGHFTSGTPLYFSIKFTESDRTTLCQLIEHIHHSVIESQAKINSLNAEISSLHNLNSDLEGENHNLTQALQSIYNSRSWKLIQKTTGAIHKLKTSH